MIKKLVGIVFYEAKQNLLDHTPNSPPTQLPRQHHPIPHADFRLSLDPKGFPLPSREAPRALFRAQGQNETSHLRRTNPQRVLPSPDLRRSGEARRVRDDAEESLQDGRHSRLALC